MALLKMEKYLILNSGSTSYKASVYDTNNLLYSAHLEIIENKYFIHEIVTGSTVDFEISAKNFERAISFILIRLKTLKIIDNLNEIRAVGLRIVAPGIYFQDNRIIDRTYLKNLKLAIEKAPLHLSNILFEIKQIKKSLPKAYLVGVSDSAFHKNIPDFAKYYALPIDLSRRYEIFRYGYHGLSVQSVVAKLIDKLGRLPDRVIVCHLGGGASVTPVYRGKSLDNSMGFSPTDGLVMATRIGPIDSGAIVYLMNKLGIKPKKLLQFLNKNCGLLGLSNNKSSDIRDLLKYEAMGDFSAKLALDVYVDRVKKLISQAAASLNGVDVLVFTGTVGERSVPIRERVCLGLDFLGLNLDQTLNNQSISINTKISTSESLRQIYIIKTDELNEIWHETKRLTKIL